MQVIEGQNVDLISPFPITEVPRTYGWMHCYKSVVETDLSPKTQEDYLPYMAELLGRCVSWGMIDKNHLTNSKHEAPLVGLLLFEPLLPWTGYLHIATARKAWRTGIADEAVELGIKECFQNIPSLTRLSAYMHQRNAPAIGLAKRHGFVFEGLFHDMIVQNSEPANLVYFGLTRRNWQCPSLQSDLPSASEEPCLEGSENPESKAE